MNSKLCSNPDKTFKCSVPVFWDPEVNRYREVDTKEIHNCPYWKPNPNYRKKPKIQLKPEDQAILDKIEKEVNQGSPSTTVLEQLVREIKDLTTEIKTLSGKVEGFFDAWTAENSYKKASDIEK